MSSQRLLLYSPKVLKKFQTNHLFPCSATRTISGAIRKGVAQIAESLAARTINFQSII
jgi:hypothetical protein